MEIPAHVVTLDEIEAELAEIDENLIRNELTVLQRGEQLVRRKELAFTLASCTIAPTQKQIKASGELCREHHSSHRRFSRLGTVNSQVGDLVAADFRRH